MTATETKKKRGRPEGRHPETYQRKTPYITISIAGSPEEIQHLRERAQEADKSVSRYVLDLTEAAGPRKKS